MDDAPRSLLCLNKSDYHRARNNYMNIARSFLRSLHSNVIVVAIVILVLFCAFAWVRSSFYVNVIKINRPTWWATIESESDYVLMGICHGRTQASKPFMEWESKTRIDFSRSFGRERYSFVGNDPGAPYESFGFHWHAAILWLTGILVIVIAIRVILRRISKIRRGKGFPIET